MNEVVIPIKMEGLGSLKSQLKDLKNELQNATDPADIARLSAAAGELKDRIGDANDQISVMASGSKFEQVSKGFGGIKDSLMSLDFEEAAQKSKAFAKNLGSINPAEIGKAMKGLTSTVTTLGGAFLKLGAQILVNPIFLIAAVIIAIVAAIVIVLNKFGVLDKVLKVLMAPINALIDGFKALTDWLGLTSFAADENADRMEAANKRVQESSKKRADGVAGDYDYEIKMAKLNGKDTTQLEIDKNTALNKEAILRRESNKKDLKAMAHQTGEDAVKRRAELKKSIDAENALIKAGVRDSKLIRAQSAVDQAKDTAADAKQAASDAAAAAKEAAAKAKEYAKNRLDAARALKDYELSQIKDATEREIATVQEKYARMLTDLKADGNKTKEEKAKFTEIYKAQQIAEVAKINEAKVKTEQENLTKNNQIIADLTLELMAEGTDKEIAMQADKYAKLRAAALADTTLTETQRAALLDLYAKQDQAATDKRAADKAAAQTTLAESLLTKDEQEALALEAKYKKDQELASGNYELLEALRKKHDTAIADAIITANNAEVEADRQKRDAKLQIANDILGGITNIGGMLIKDQKKLEKFNKASALVQIGVDTAKAISGLVAAANTNPLNGVTAGAAGIAQYVTGAIQIATNIAKAKQILSSGGSPSSGGGAGGGGGTDAPNVAQAVPTGPTLFGQGNNSGTFGAGGSSNESSMTVTAIVSETQVTTVQDKINRINKNAEL